MMNKDVFPVYKNDGYSILSLNSNQRQAVKVLVDKINDGSYKFRENDCQCGNAKSKSDILVSEKDMFGIPNDNVLCSSCGMIRSTKILEDEYIAEYYNKDYKPINYNLSQKTGETYYTSQMPRGKQFFELYKKVIGEPSGLQVYDMGCGSGGVMHYFNELDNTCKGNDYSKEFLAFGNSKGMALSYGDMDDDTIDDESIDLFILAHVYEHLTDTNSYLKRIFSKIKIGGVLLLEVPGVYADIPHQSGYPLAGCQFAHVVNFYHKNFLKAMFQHHGLKVVYGDERCTFLVEKTKEANFNHPFVFQDVDGNFESVTKYILNSTKKYRTFTNKTYTKRKLSALLKGKIF